MSLRAIIAVFERSEARLAHRLVLLALADYAHDDGSNAHPSVKTLARKARVDERTVQRALADLVATGELVKTGQTKHGVSIWTLRPGGDNLSPEGLLANGSLTGSGDILSPPDRQPAGGPVTSRRGNWRCPYCPVDDKGNGVTFASEDDWYEHINRLHAEV